MGSNTSVHGFYKPDAGEDGWASLVNANFDDLDTLLNGFTTNGESLTLGGTLDVSGDISFTSESDFNFSNGTFLSDSSDQIAIATSGSGSSQVVLFDNNSTSSILIAEEGGKVSIPNGDLDVSGNDINNAGTVSATDASIDKRITQIYATSNQTISSGVSTQLSFDSIEDDTLNAADVANDQIVIQSDGDYILNASGKWGTDANWTTGDVADVVLYVNGTNVSPGGYRKVGTNAQTVNAGSVCLSLSNGDLVTVEVEQDSGSAIDTLGFRTQTYLNVARLG